MVLLVSRKGLHCLEGARRKVHLSAGQYVHELQIAKCKSSEESNTMKRLLLATIVFACVTSAASAQAPGWRPTGEWQCSPYVRIITSTDGRDGMDFLVIGAWFDNHYTLRRGAALLQRHPLHSVRNPTMGAANKIR